MWRKELGSGPRVLTLLQTLPFFVSRPNLTKTTFLLMVKQLNVCLFSCNYKHLALIFANEEFHFWS